jgi:hypothetical protein
MDSITLKKESGRVVTMMGFDRLNEYMIEWDKTKPIEHIWSGSKEYISLKDEDFWKELVESEPHPLWKDMGVIQFKNYINEFENFNTAKESGHSAIESLKGNNYILIVETKN